MRGCLLNRRTHSKFADEMSDSTAQVKAVNFGSCARRTSWKDPPQRVQKMEDPDSGTHLRQEPQGVPLISRSCCAVSKRSRRAVS